MRLVASVLTVVLSGAGLVGSFAKANAWTVGAITDSVISVADTSQTYAVYLPSVYTPQRTWPVVLLMDPRGRARIPLERFLPAAERLGYVLISSYGTASDTFEDVNTPAVRAMFDDAGALLAVDDMRLYLAGFSGTARIAWTFAQLLSPHVAGILGFGAGLPVGHPAPWHQDFVFFGAAGGLDYNYEEMQTLDRNLDVRDLPHRFEFFEGGHQWAPEQVCTRGLDFMEVQAMRRGLIARDQARIDAIYGERAAEVVSSKDDYEKWIRLDAVAEDFSGLLEPVVMDSIAVEVDALQRMPSVRDAVRRRNEFAQEFRDYRGMFEQMIEASQASDDWTAARMIQHLRIDDLTDRSKDLADPESAGAARRLLELVFVHTSLYLPRDYLEQHDLDRAFAALQVAAAIRALDAARLERDFPSLGSDPRFTKILAAARRR